MRENGIRKTIIQIATLATLMVVTYYLIMRDKDIHSVVDVMLHCSKIWLIIAAACMALFVFCGGWAIRVLMKGRGCNLTIWQCFKYSFIEFYFSALTPSSSGGQPAQLYQMSKDGYSTSDGTVVLVAITALYKFSFLVITAVLILLNFNFMRGPISSTWILMVLGLILNLGLIAILLLCLFSTKTIRFIIGKGTAILGKLHLVKDIEAKKADVESKVANYHECATFFASNKGLVVKTFLVLTLQRMMLLIVPYLVYKAFGLKGYSMLQILATQCLLNLCVDMMPLPGAVGISETVFLMLFTPIFHQENVTTAVLLSRGISFYLLVVVAGVVVMGCQVANIVKTNRKSKSEKGGEELGEEV